MLVPYGLLQSQLVRLNNLGPDIGATTANNGHVDVLTANSSTGSQDQQIPLAVASSSGLLIQSESGYHVIRSTKQDIYSLSAVTSAAGRPFSSHANQAFWTSSKQPALVHHRKLSLRGEVSVRSSASVKAAVAPIGATAGPTAWQLQPQGLIPSCKGLQLLPGQVTCCCLLVARAQLQQKQQRELQQLLQQAGAVGCNSSSEEVLQLLATSAIACIAASNCGIQHHQQQQAEMSQCSPVLCTPDLYTAATAALADRPSSGSTTTASSSTSSPPCLFLAATSTGQVWVCDPWFSLLGSSSSRGSVCADGAARGTTECPHQEQYQQTAQQGHLPNTQHTGLRLLLHLQQPVMALLPMLRPTAQQSSSCSSSSGVGEAADAFLLIGSLGRVGLLHSQPRQQQLEVQPGTIAAAPGAGSAAPPAAAAADQEGQGSRSKQQFAMSHQQLPFTVQAAALARCLTDLQQQQQGQHQQQPSGLLLLLLSGTGSLYVANVAAACTAAGGGAATVAANSACSSSSRHVLQLRPQKLDLPGQVQKLWALSLQQQRQQQQSMNSFLSDFPAAQTGGATNSSRRSSITTVIVQLQGSNQLLQLDLGRNSITQQQRQQQQQQLTGRTGTEAPIDRHSSTKSPAAAAAAAAAAARRKLQSLMSALETLTNVRQSLEQNIMKQDQYLVAVGQDLSLLKSLGLSSAQMVAPAVLGEQQGQATTAGTSVLGVRPTAPMGCQQHHQQQLMKLACDITLQGLWPAPAAAAAAGSSAGCSSSMHLAVTVQLQVRCSSSSSSSSSLARPGLGPGWQLLVSFTPESAQSPSWLTTVPMSLNHSQPGDRTNPFAPGWGNSSNSDDTGMRASLLLPLPDQCLSLTEGGWLQVYAVKLAPSSLHLHSATAAAAAMHAAGGKGTLRGNSHALPAVALLSEQHVSVLQLSSLLAANPAAAVLPAFVATRAAAATDMDGARQSYSCILQLQAARVVGSDAGTLQQQQQEMHLQPSHKRPRADVYLGARNAQHGPQQQQILSTQQQLEHNTPLGTMLGDWLKSIAEPQQGNPGHHSSSSSSGSRSANLAVPGYDNRLALLHGQVGYKLGYGSRGRLTWASRAMLPSQPQQATKAPSAVAAPPVAGSAVDGLGGELRLPVQVAVQASTVSGLAQMHRSFIMAALLQLQKASAGVMMQDIVHRADNTSNGWWCIVAQRQQLQEALHQLTQLHQQLMRLQNAAENAIDARTQVLAAVKVAIDGGGALSTYLSPDHSKPSSAHLLEHLVGLLSSWESGVCNGYGRALLALTSSSCLLCCEG